MAHGLSLVFHPILTGAYVLLVAGAVGATSVARGVGWGLLTIVVASGLPAADLLVRLRTGRVSSIDVALREQRARPLVVTLVCCMAALAMLVVLDGPETLIVSLVAALVSGVVLTIITMRWKISFHMAVLAGGIVVLAWAAGPLVLVGSGLLAAVGWARVYLRRHAVGQVVAGALVGAALTAVVVTAAGPIGG